MILGFSDSGKLPHLRAYSALRYSDIFAVSLLKFFRAILILRSAGVGGGGRRVALLPIVSNFTISKYSPKIVLQGEGGGNFFLKFALRNISIAP